MLEFLCEVLSVQEQLILVFYSCSVDIFDFAAVAAPEIFDCAADLCVGYGFPVDWWSLGVCAYECARGVRPFDIHSATNISDVRALFAAGVYYPSWMSRPFVDLLSRVSSCSARARSKPAARGPANLYGKGAQP